MARSMCARTTAQTRAGDAKNPYSLHAERALSSNDQRHRFVFSRPFNLPFANEEDGKKSSGVIAELLGNVEAAPILTIGSGRPINQLTGFDANRSGAFPLSSRLLGLSRNPLAIPTQVQFGLRVLKFFKIGEHGKLDFARDQFYGPGVHPFQHSRHPTSPAFRGNYSSQLALSSDELAVTAQSPIKNHVHVLAENSNHKGR